MPRVITLLGNVASGVLGGLAVAAVFSLVMLAGPYRGSFVYGGTPGTLIRAYFLAGLVGGPVFGVLRPLARSRLGAWLVGLVVALLVDRTIAATVEAPVRWTVGRVALAAAVIGGAIGWHLGWGRSDRQPRTTDQTSARDIS